MNEDQHIEMIQKLSDIDGKVQWMAESFSEFKHGIGARQEKSETHIYDHCGEIKLIAERLNNVTRILWGTGGAIGMAILYALLKVILR